MSLKDKISFVFDYMDDCEYNVNDSNEIESFCEDICRKTFEFKFSPTAEPPRLPLYPEWHCISDGQAHRSFPDAGTRCLIFFSHTRVFMEALWDGHRFMSHYMRISDGEFQAFNVCFYDKSLPSFWTKLGPLVNNLKERPLGLRL